MSKVVPEGKFVDVGDGLKIHYQEQGAGKNTLVFLHGSGPGASGYSNFRRNYPFFAEHGFRTIVPDTLGYGYSSKPETDYTLDFLVGALERALTKIGVDKCAVVGNSHGGAMAIKLALNRPDLVEKLVLMAPGGLEVRETYMKMAGIRTMMKVFLDPNGFTRESMRKIFELQLFDVNQVTEDILDERWSIAVDQPKRVLTSMVVPHLTPELNKLEMPVFALWGVNDQYCPVSGAMTIATEVKHARVTMLSQCGHWVMVEYAQLFNRACLDFLTESAS